MNTATAAVQDQPSRIYIVRPKLTLAERSVSLATRWSGPTHRESQMVENIELRSDDSWR